MVAGLKNAYALWLSYGPHLPKAARYTLGEKIDRALLDGLEYALAASFAKPTEKALFLSAAIRKTDLAQVLVQLAWETRVLDEKKYLALAETLSTAGRMLGGWLGKTEKENSPPKVGGER